MRIYLVMYHTYPGRTLQSAWTTLKKANAEARRLEKVNSDPGETDYHVQSVVVK